MPALRGGIDHKFHAGFPNSAFSGLPKFPDIVFWHFGSYLREKYVVAKTSCPLNHQRAPVLGEAVPRVQDRAGRDAAARDAAGSRRARHARPARLW